MGTFQKSMKRRPRLFNDGPNNPSTLSRHHWSLVGIRHYCNVRSPTLDSSVRNWPLSIAGYRRFHSRPYWGCGAGVKIYRQLSPAKRAELDMNIGAGGI